MADHARIKTQYLRFAENECQGYSDLYFSLAHAVTSDDDLVGFISQMPVTQPNLFFASIQFLTGPDRMPTTSAELKEIVRDRNKEIASLMKTRRTQTNEVGRCAAILPALPRGRLALLEVGASAGLCLLMDEFFYDYGVQHVGSESSTVRLRCAAKNPLPSLDAMPEIVWRGGLDLSPVNLNADDDRQWLLSCVFADHAERRDRLTAAIEIAKPRELSVRRGDLASDLNSLLAEVPRDADLVVFHSAVLAYVSVENRVRFAQVLTEASRSRKIVWISNEAPTVVPGITALAPPVRPPAFLLGRTTFANGKREDELLALAHPHGAELEWLTPKFRFPDLETSRTHLRILTLEDVESVYRHFSDESVTRFMDIEPCSSWHDARDIIEFHLKDSGCRWGIFDKDTNTLLGTCGYHCWARDESPYTAEIGYDLGKAHWGRGLMEEVLQVVISFGYSEMDLIRIEARPLSDNVRSIRLLTKLGFRAETAVRDGCQMFHLLKGDWNACGDI